MSLNTFDDFEEGNVLSKLLEAGVKHFADFSLGDSSLKGLGFISPIKVIKELGLVTFLDPILRCWTRSLLLDLGDL